MADRSLTASAKCPANVSAITGGYTVQNGIQDLLQVVSVAVYDLDSGNPLDVSLEPGHSMARMVVVLNRIPRANEVLIFVPDIPDFGIGSPAWAAWGLPPSTTQTFDFNVENSRPTVGNPSLTVTGANAYVYTDLPDINLQPNVVFISTPYIIEAATS